MSYLYCLVCFTSKNVSLSKLITSVGEERVGSLLSINCILKFCCFWSKKVCFLCVLREGIAVLLSDPLGLPYN